MSATILPTDQIKRRGLPGAKMGTSDIHDGPIQAQPDLSTRFTVRMERS